MLLRSATPLLLEPWGWDLRVKHSGTRALRSVTPSGLSP